MLRYLAAAWFIGSTWFFLWRLRHMDAQLATLIQESRHIMATNDKLLEISKRLDTATNEIAADLAALRTQIADKVDQATLDTLDANVTRLEAMGADVNNPVPPVEG